MTSSPPAAAVTAVGCGGDGCSSKEPWPLHHVRHRGVFCRLCSSCVLRYHPSLFCPSCLSLFTDSNTTTTTHTLDTDTIHCSKCPSISHLACLSDSSITNLDPATFLCPSCANPGANPLAFLPSPTAVDPATGRRLIDERSVRVLLAAARIAASSMARAAAFARADADRKVRDAAVARKRARDMLNGFFLKKDGELKSALTPLSPALVPKKKTPKMNANGNMSGNAVYANADARAAPKKAVANKVKDKWLKFNEIPPLEKRAGAAMAAAAAAVGSDVKNVPLGSPLPRPPPPPAIVRDNVVGNVVGDAKKTESEIKIMPQNSVLQGTSSHVNVSVEEGGRCRQEEIAFQACKSHCSRYSNNS